MCTMAGNMYVPASAPISPKSFTNFPTFSPALPSVPTRVNTKTNAHTSTFPSPSWKAAVVERRIDMRIDILGVVVSKKGMRRTKVKADRTARSGFGGWVDVSGLFGDAEKNTRGSIRSIAVATDERDNILNDRYFGVLVDIGWTDPLRATYSGRVEDDVNAKAIAVVPSQRPLLLSQTALTPKDPIPCP